MEKIAVFPGTFDPFTVGHEALVKRSLKLFDKVIVAVGKNVSKSNLFTIEQRVDMINEVFEGEDKVDIVSYEGLTVDFCEKVGAKFLLRGLRTAADFEYERAIGQVNKAMKPEIETVFMLTAPEHTPVNSTIVRDVLINKGDATKFLPKGININKYLTRLLCIKNYNNGLTKNLFPNSFNYPFLPNSFRASNYLRECTILQR